MYYDNKKLALNIFWIILGATLIILSVTEILDSSIYSGMGGGLLAVGVIQLIRNVKYRKDPSYKEKVDIDAHDERNTYIRMRSWSYTGYISVLTGAVGTVVALITGQDTLRLYFSFTVCFVLVVYWISYLINSKRC